MIEQEIAKRYTKCGELLHLQAIQTLTLKDALFLTLCLFTFGSWVGTTANCTKCLITYHPSVFPRAWQSNVSCISARELGTPMTSSSYKLVVLPFLRKEFGLLPNKKVYLMVFAPSLLPLASHQQSLCIRDFITKEMKHHSYPLSA